MYNKKISAYMATAIIFANTPVRAIASIVDNAELTIEKRREFINSRNEQTKRIKENKVKEENKSTKIVAGLVCELTLSSGQFVPTSLAGNPDGYETIRITTTGGKSLNTTDFYRLADSRIPNIDLSKASATEIPAGTFGPKTGSDTFLESFKFPIGVTRIGGSAFGSCTKLTGDLIIPDTVTRIESYAFNGCTGFDGRLILPSSLKIIEERAFANCQYLTGDINIPSGVTSIGASAFNYCSGLTGDLIIPDSVTTLGERAFYACRGLNGRLYISKGITTIGKETFYDCENLVGDLIIPDNVTNLVDGYTFRGCEKLNGQLYISKNLTEIPDYTFEGCSSLTGALSIPEKVTYIGRFAFSSCEGLAGELNIHSNINTISTAAFAGCSGFTGDLIIPDTVTTLGGTAFSGCSGFNGRLSITNSITAIDGSTFKNCSGLKGQLVIPETIEHIYGYAFSGCSGFVGELKLPQNLQSIRASAFANCTGFTGKLIIPDSVTTLGSAAFYKCNGFTENLVIPSQLTIIEEETFLGCTGFTGNIMIPALVTELGPGAFQGCTGFNGTLSIPDGVTKIGANAFNGCKGLIGELKIPSTTKTIGASAFNGCSGFTGNVIIPDVTTTLGASAFNGCSKIEKILIKVNSSNATSIGLTTYRKLVINNLPNTEQVYIDVPYDFDITGTWLETTNRVIAKPQIKDIHSGIESDLVNNKSYAVSLHIPSLYKEGNVVVLKDGERVALPSKDINNRHIFRDAGLYHVTITTDLGNISVIEFEVEDGKFISAEEAVQKAEESKDVNDLEDARDLVNALPECSIKDQLEDRLDAIFPNIEEVARKEYAANADIYIIPKHKLSLSLNTNQITFKDYSGAEDSELKNALNITVNSTLSYSINAYLPEGIVNADKSESMDVSLLNIKESGDSIYKSFTGANNKVVVKDNCAGGAIEEHSLDLKLAANTHKVDVYKTVLKLEIEQK